mmetsp:Transcript_24357/g.61242  ORF Transcript_24357/g.61242 Transcript_24357/m.61242 type:complete len:399 (+) Transcript_24357:1040-2236(+)
MWLPLQGPPDQLYYRGRRENWRLCHGGRLRGADGLYGEALQRAVRGVREGAGQPGHPGAHDGAVLPGDRRVCLRGRQRRADGLRGGGDRDVPRRIHKGARQQHACQGLLRARLPDVVRGRVRLGQMRAQQLRRLLLQATARRGGDRRREPRGGREVSSLRLLPGELRGGAGRLAHDGAVRDLEDREAAWHHHQGLSDIRKDQRNKAVRLRAQRALCVRRWRGADHQERDLQLGGVQRLPGKGGGQQAGHPRLQGIQQHVVGRLLHGRRDAGDDGVPGIRQSEVSRGGGPGQWLQGAGGKEPDIQPQAERHLCQRGRGGGRRRMHDLRLQEAQRGVLEGRGVHNHHRKLEAVWLPAGSHPGESERCRQGQSLHVLRVQGPWRMGANGWQGGPSCLQCVQ